MSYRDSIISALAGVPGDDFVEASLSLLDVLGYRSDRTLLDQSDDPHAFIHTYGALRSGTQSEREFLDHARSVRILFQVTDSEIDIEQDDSLSQGSFNVNNISSFLFVAVELGLASYPRSKYIAFAREINKRLQMPAVVLFRSASDQITFTFVHRRPHSLDPTRDVIGRVSLVREIEPTRPHRAHLDILADLALHERLKWLTRMNMSHNFDGLLVAWLDALDTEELNRSFYQALFKWFERAVREAEFPTNEVRILQPEEHIIRLITRLLFVWFLKEKGLVAEDLFIEERIKALLRDYDGSSGDSYYRAVLQNLFFATLNVSSEQRGFTTGTRSTHRNFSLYRYRPQIAQPDELIKLFETTPFINGGLFDCLDSEVSTGNDGYRIDCFSDVHYHKLSIPNTLFFDDDGLITLFNQYKFTVEENTPTEQEVALDPELLGKVFENLLAAYNPETRESARKQTGSYYTPRTVVDYMVDESLVCSLVEKAQPDDGDVDFWQDRLRYLFNYDDAFEDAEELFTPREREGLVRAIVKIKIIDPAVGSGAFPMGILHKLTLALRRLDPSNLLWESLQEELAGQRAFAALDTSDEKNALVHLDGIRDTFKRYRDSDFGRKLYLIQNSIYGVDIQPMAVSIAKLRFFISLAIDQQPNDNSADNYGIKPLPNLETRFVIADTLLTLQRPAQQAVWQTDEIKRLEIELQRNRERHFHATTRTTKLACYEQDLKLRGELKTALKSSGFPANSANQIAVWDPFDHNAIAARWFDAKYMFGIAEGFDIVIGNPPYVEARNNLLSVEMKELYGSQVKNDWNEQLPRGSDLLIYFLARTPKLLCDTGIGCLITQNAWLYTDYGKKFQDFSIGKFSVSKIIDNSSRFFKDRKSQDINTVIVILNRKLPAEIEYKMVDDRMDTLQTKSIDAKQTMKWGHIFVMPHYFRDILESISEAQNSPLWTSFGQGLNPPRKELNEEGALLPIILGEPRFVATSAEGKISSRWVKPGRKIPALIMPRGVGDRYYCTFNSIGAFSYSGVEMYLSPDLFGEEIHYCFWLYMNSSFVWLFRELTGRRNLGGGMLKAEVTDMKRLPTRFTFDFHVEAREVFDRLQARHPLPVEQEVYTEEHLIIDDLVSNFFGFHDQQDQIRMDLVEQVNFRTARARSS